LVVSETMIDHGPEWRSFNSSEKNDKSRTGSPMTELLHDKGLSTNIDWKNRDSSGRVLSPDKRAQMQRLRKWDFRSKHDSKSSNIAYANGEIQRMGASLGAPKSAQETAASLYRQAQENELIPGRSIEAIAGACLYISLRTIGKSRSLDELSSVGRVERKELQRAYSYLSREFELELEPADPTEYIPRISTQLPVNSETEQLAISLLSNVTETHHVSGNDPTVLAASAIYAASIVNGKLLTQVSVREAADVTEVSIRNNYQMFLKQADDIEITEDELDNAETPMQVAQCLTENPEYANHHLNNST